jgi:hypothetical protein
MNLLPTLLLLAAQAGPERLVFADRSELPGELSGVDASGALLFRDVVSGRTLNVGAEEVWKIAFEGDAQPAEEKPGEASVRFLMGGGLSGRSVRFEKDEAVVEHPAGLLRARRSELRSLQLGPVTGALPEIKEGTDDILLREDEKKALVAETGRLVSLGDAAVLSGPGGDHAFPRASVRQILLRGRVARNPEVPAGWFAKVAFRNGDKIVAILRGAPAGKVALFSTALGAVEVERRHLRSITFMPSARLSVGNLLICDQTGVREVDRAGREIWSYQQSAQYAWSARKLENGNVLVANTNFNQVLEIRPTGRTGGEIVWRLDQANYPYDAARLDNGNTLVAEYAMNRIVEYDAKMKPVWQHAVDYPQSVQRLENGNTLICTSVSVVEVTRQNQERWRLNATGLRPHRATRLENGNTLVVDHQRGRVVEFNAQSAEVWKAPPGLSRPVQAIRMDDGGTLILEQGANRVVEIDPAGNRRALPEIRDLRYPQGMSMY